MYVRLSLCCLALLALIPVACNSARGDQDQPILAPFELSAAEIQTARDLAERGLSDEGKAYYIKTELLPDSQADTQQRKVMVTHYRYQGDETLYSFVDLNTAELYQVEKKQHAPTALAPEETALAEQLARTDPFIAGQVQTHGNRLRLQIVPCNPTSEDPQYGHRLAVVLLQVGAEYLTGPRILVDLTTETVETR